MSFPANPSKHKMTGAHGSSIGGLHWLLCSPERLADKPRERNHPPESAWISGRQKLPVQGHLPLPETRQSGWEVCHCCHASQEPACLLKQGICTTMNSYFKSL